MLTLKRVFTAFVSFFFLLFVFYFGIVITGGAISGAIAGVKNQTSENVYLAGQQAGALFVQNNISVIILATLLLSSVLSLWLSFAGIFPWCRKTDQSSAND